MGWFDGGNQDTVEGQGGSLIGTLTSGIDAIKETPLGSIWSGVNAAYHTGAAVYDGINGNRDAAIAHGAQAAVNGLGVIPGVSDVIGGADKILGDVGGVARQANNTFGTPGKGIEPGDIPMSVSDIVSNAAVGATNMIFGADDSNWIAPGDKPQGTRQGEINAGLGAVATTALNAGLGPLGMIPLLTGQGIGNDLGNAAGNAIGSMFGTSNEPGSAGGGQTNVQKGALKIHDQLTKPSVAGGGGGPTPGTGGGGPSGGSAGAPGSGAAAASAKMTPTGGPAAASGQMTPNPAKSYSPPGTTPLPTPAPPAVSPKLSPGGNGGGGGGGGGAGGPMPKLPWFFERPGIF